MFMYIISASDRHKYTYSITKVKQTRVKTAEKTLSSEYKVLYNTHLVLVTISNKNTPCRFETDIFGIISE